MMQHVRNSSPDLVDLALREDLDDVEAGRGWALRPRLRYRLLVLAAFGFLAEGIVARALILVARRLKVFPHAVPARVVVPPQDLIVARVLVRFAS